MMRICPFDGKINEIESDWIEFGSINDPLPF